ncbi:MAG: peptidase thermolysin, partial [Nocardioides sp.]|nr:peptidase thermolysin [Nocardioides sp.]
AAVGIGGSSWEGAGRVWYDALTGGRVGPRTDFSGFALETVAVAGAHAAVVREAWATVGVSPRTSALGASASSLPAPERVTVRRTGGFAGLVSSGSVDLDTDDPRATEVRSLLDRIDLRRVAGGPPHPDRFVYTFDLRGAQATVPEQHLTDDLRRLVDLVLEGSGER